jgi:hypothetical protein
MKLKNNDYVNHRTSTKQRVLKVELMNSRYSGPSKSKVLGNEEGDEYNPSKASIARAKLKKAKKEKLSKNKFSLCW